MDKLRVVLVPQEHSTQVLAMRGEQEVLRAVLGSPHQVHRLAAPLLLEGLALWEQTAVSVVLSVDESDASSPLTRSLCADGHRLGEATLCYQVQVVPTGRRAGRSVGGVGEFGALRRLCRGGELWR